MATQPNQTGLQVDPIVREQIEQLAASRETTPEEIVRKAVEYYASGTETHDEFLQRGLAAIAGYEATGLHLTGEEVDEWLAKVEAGERPPMPPCHT